MQKWYASHTVCGTFTQIIAYKMPRELKEIINKEQRNKKKTTQNWTKHVSCGRISGVKTTQRTTKTYLPA